MEKKSFHNTTAESGQVRILFEEKAESQEETILMLFRKECRPMAWGEVAALVDFPEISIKRSLTNLKTSGHLETTSEKVIGIYGRPSYKYKLIK